MRVAVIPPPAPNNPWQRRLYGDLAERGVSTVGGEMKPWWPRRAAGAFDLVHLHWIEYLMVSEGDRFAPARAAAAAASVEATLRILRARGVPTVWTLHNPEPHSSPAPAVHRWLNRRAGALVDVVIVHSQFAAGWARVHNPPRGELVVAAHPNYVGEYASSDADPAQVRARHGIPQDAYVFLAFGAVQPYKRVADAVAAFTRVASPHARFLVVGSPAHAGEVRRLRELGAADPRVVLDLRHAPDDEVHDLFAAVDTAVIGYEVFSSGVLMLALSNGCPVLAPATGAATEVAGAPAVTARPVSEFGEAMATLVAEGPSPARRAAALAAAEAFPVRRQAEEHLHAYELAARAARAQR